MGERAADELRYRAFLSYSHKDAAAAGRLHRKLEAYRMPRRLVGTRTARGIVPERLWPIFRDREELPAATDLSETVREALARSGALIILCSPHAASSLWVAEEIETFRALHPDRPILATVLDGDPPDCFPAALRAQGRDGGWHEPLATDLRPHCDGPRLGLLKLVAGITGVGLDDLVQRDAARRIRRVMAVTSAALVAMLAMAALALVAINARGEAERQRAEAEGLAGFMLTDLHDRLRGVGRLEIMQSVNRRALAYYDLQIGRGDRSARTLLQRARVLQAIGEEDVRLGHTESALALFLEARRITAVQLAEGPNDPERIFAQGQSDFWVGRVRELSGDWPEAERFYRLYALGAERLIAIAPQNPRYMMEMAYGLLNLGRARTGAGDPAAAQPLLERSTTWFRAVVAARPADVNARIELANAYADLADSFLARSLWPQMLVARQKQLQILDPLYNADPTNIEIRFRLAAAQYGVGRALSLAGVPNDARPFLTDANDSLGSLTGLDPRNGEWLFLRTKVQCALYYGPGSPREGGRAQLAHGIREGVAALRRRRDSRAAELIRCEQGLD